MNETEATWGVLQERGKISAESLQQLFQDQKGKVIRLGELILERGLVEKSALTKALEEVSRVPYLDCTTVICDMRALAAIPAGVARGWPCCPSDTNSRCWSSQWPNLRIWPSSTNSGSPPERQFLPASAFALKFWRRSPGIMATKPSDHGRSKSKF